MTSEHDRFDQLCGEGEVSGPVDEEAIAHAETELGVKFPPEYRDLLGRYGAIIAPGLEVYGLLRNATDLAPPLWQDVVSVTNELRSFGQIGSEKKYLIPIASNGDGVYFFLNTLNYNKTVIHAIGPGFEKIFDNGLFSFLIKLAEGSLEL